MNRCLHRVVLDLGHYYYHYSMVQQIEPIQIEIRNITDVSFELDGKRKKGKTSKGKMSKRKYRKLKYRKLKFFNENNVHEIITYFVK